MQIQRLIIFFIILFSSTHPLISKETASKSKSKPQLLVFTGSYNNVRWIDRYVRSLASQDYRHWKCVYVNDASSDQTSALIKKTVKKYKVDNHFKIIDNPTRHGLVDNMFTYLNKISGKYVVVIIDGDDFLAHKRVFSRIAKAYKNPKTWTTYGNYKAVPKNIEHKSLCHPIPKKIKDPLFFRKSPWFTSHLRTFYAKLFHKIKKEDLQENGQFFQTAGDVATMLPILEMSRKGHILFIPEVLLFYNTINPLSDYHKIQEQQRVDKFIRKKAPYMPLKKLVF